MSPEAVAVIVFALIASFALGYGCGYGLIRERARAGRHIRHEPLIDEYDPPPLPGEET